MLSQVKLSRGKEGKHFWQYDGEKTKKDKTWHEVGPGTRLLMDGLVNPYFYDETDSRIKLFAQEKELGDLDHPSRD